MKLPNQKTLLAPVLAIALACLLTGAIYYSPLPTAEGEPQLQIQASPEPSQKNFPAATLAAPSPAPAESEVYGQSSPPARTAELAAGGLPEGVLPALFAVAAVIVAVLAVGLFFSERNLNKED